MNIEVKNGEVFLDGYNAGRIADAKANYPELAEQIDAAIPPEPEPENSEEPTEI